MTGQGPRPNAGDIAGLLADVLVAMQARDQSKAHDARRLAPDFNVVEIRRPNGHRLSGVLATLLYPGGTHGQGKVFLRLFLRDVARIDGDIGLRSALVRTEVGFEQGRPDVVVRQGDWTASVARRLRRSIAG